MSLVGRVHHQGRLLFVLIWIDRLGDLPIHRVIKALLGVYGLRKIKNLKGKRFGRLRVLEKTQDRKWGYVVWLCQCDCGKTKKVTGHSLTKGEVKSCGCLRSKNSHKHGDTAAGRTRLYTIWQSMKSRCFNPNATNYKYYGAKGISVCKKWRNNYLAFKFWAILNGYQDNLTIDRIASNGDYEPSNCQWLTNSENLKKRWQQNKKQGKRMANSLRAARAVNPTP